MFHVKHLNKYHEETIGIADEYLYPTEDYEMNSKLENKYIATFKTVNTNGFIRSNQRMIHGKDIGDAKTKLTKQLAEQYDWYQIGTIIEAKNDHPQGSL